MLESVGQVVKPSELMSIPTRLVLAPANHSCYSAYGLVFSSFIELPELLPTTGTPDVFIRQSDLPDGLEHPLTNQAFIQTDANQMLLTLGEQVGANFLIRNGNEMLVDVVNDDQIDQIRLALLGYGLTSLLFQRGYLVLHGNTIQTPSGAITVCGQQQAGKSTLTTALYKRGFGIIADDLTAVDLTTDDLAVDALTTTEMSSLTPVVIPGFPRLKLWEDTLTYFGEPFDSLRRIQPDYNKYSFPLNGSFHNRSEPLTALYILKKSAIDKPRLQYLTGLQKLRAICSQIRSYRPEQLPLGERWLLEKGSALAAKIEVAIVERPAEGNSIEAVANLIEADCRKR